MKTPPAHPIIQYTGFYHGAPALGQDQNMQLAGTLCKLSVWKEIKQSNLVNKYILNIGYTYVQKTF